MNDSQKTGPDWDAFNATYVPLCDRPITNREIAWRCFQAGRAAVQAAQPESVGWKLVPIEPTPAMWTAGGRAIKECGGHERDAASLAYAAMLASAPTPEPMSAPTAESVATLWVQMETHDMGQSLAPNPPFKVAIAKAHTAAKDLPLGEYLLYATPPSAATEPSDAERLDWLENNLFHVEPDEWTAKYSPHLNTWRIFAPKSVQGSARTIIDAAIRATKGGTP